MINTKKFYNDMYLSNPTRWEPWDRPIHPFDKNIINLININSSPVKIVDLGCGNGRTLELLSGNWYELHGIDYSSVAVELAQKRLSNKAKIIEGDMTNTTYEDGYFDYVLGVGSFEHQEILNFSEPNRLLKNSGYFICVLPDTRESKGLTIATDGKHHDWELTQEDWINKITPFGFKFIKYLEPWTFVFEKERNYET